MRLNGNMSASAIPSSTDSTSSNSNLESANDFAAFQTQPINLSKVKEESAHAPQTNNANNEVPLDLSNRKSSSEKKEQHQQQQVHTVNSLYSSTVNKITNNFNSSNDFNGTFALFLFLLLLFLRVVKSGTTKLWNLNKKEII